MRKKRVLTPEHRAKISASMKGNTRAKGHVHSKEHRAQVSATMRGRSLTAGHRENISTGSRGKIISVKQRAKISATLSYPLGSSYINAQGYRCIKTEDGWEREHRVIAGLVPLDGLVAHHRDGDRLNNDKSNLEVMLVGEHTKYHKKMTV